MQVKVIGKGSKKAEVIVIEETTYGKTYTTRHLLFKDGRWKDNYGNYYDESLSDIRS